MKLWEAIRLLEEDPSREFEYQDNQKKWRLYADAGCYDDRVFYMLDRLDNKGELKTGHMFGSLHGNLSTADNWKIVKEPVTWQEAFQAWIDGCDIRCEGVALVSKFKNGSLLLNNLECPPSKWMMKNGKWYIED